MALHPVSRVKLSTQIENQLKDQILTGKWKPGERLPSENELAEIFQVSRVSIRRLCRPFLPKWTELKPASVTVPSSASPASVPLCRT
ncbi:MAG: winged helix-turn-helix domain-containing protein [Dysosmobacter sp.]